MGPVWNCNLFKVFCPVCPSWEKPACIYHYNFENDSDGVAGGRIRGGFLEVLLFGAG